MSIVKRAAAERGRTKLDWLDSWHSFSFGDYYDPAHVSFRALRVINDDVVAPSTGFNQHGHRDAEILTYVLEGRLAHKDSMGNGSVIEAGSLQYMSAGKGVLHSEMNPSDSERVRLLQIWILPDQSGGAPQYAERPLGRDAKPNALTLLFAGRARDGAIGIRADADVYVGKLDAGRKVSHLLGNGRGAWIHLIKGDVTVLGETLAPGDAVAVEDTGSIEIASNGGADLLLFDLR